MNKLTSGLTGTFHLIVSIIAMISGMMVLCRPKGTKGHKQVGYIYVIAMLLVNLTAFLIYRLFGGFWDFSFFCHCKFVNPLGRYVPHFKKKGSILFLGISPICIGALWAYTALFVQKS